MKINLPVIPPADLKEGWPGQYRIFPWYYFVLNIPTAVFMVTTTKENGQSNVQLNAWGMLIGSGTEPKFILQVMNSSDTCRLIRQNREFVINFPTYGLKEKWLKTAEHFTPESDEITAAGLTAEKAEEVSAPRIKECYAHYECVLEWMREVETENPVNTLIQGKIIHAAIDENFLANDLVATYQKRDIPFNLPEFYNHQARQCETCWGLARLDYPKIEII